MNVKKYRVTDMSEALSLIKADLGDDAYIISSQMVRQKGMLGLFKSKQLEVTAAFETKDAATSFKQSTKTVKAAIPKNENTNQIAHAQLLKVLDQLEANQFVSKETNTIQDEFKKEQLIHAALESVQENNQKTQAFHATMPLKNQSISVKPSSSEHPKMIELEKQMKKMQEKMEQLISDTQTQNDAHQSISEPTLQLTPQKITAFFKQYDFNERFETEFLKFIEQHQTKPQQLTQTLLREFLTQEVDYRVVINESPLQKVNIFVGPPGVGKTTTIAKIASNEILKSNRKIGLITVDTYRIGAVEQLKTYANILNVPLKTVYTVEDMKVALKELDYCDCIIVDSMGRTHKDQENLEELQQLFSHIETKKIFLVLSMSSKYRQLKKIIDNYRVLTYDHLLLTKLDESERNENLINICYDTQKSLTYLCTGQEVPNDMMIASKSYLISSILGGDNDE